MGLLVLLGLEKKLPDDLVAGIGRITAAARTLALEPRHRRKVARMAATVAKHFVALESRVEPWLYRRKRGQFDALAERLARRTPGEPAAAVDLAEFVMLAAEAAVAKNDVRGNRTVLADARRSYAGTLLDHLDSGGGLADDLKTYADGLVAGGASAPLAAFLQALEFWSGEPGTPQQDAATRVARRLAEEGQKRQKALGASMAERDAPRMPGDVLVHLMAQVNRACRRTPDDADLEDVAWAGRRFFMSHRFTRGDIAALVERGRQALAACGDQAGAALCDRLQRQLPAGPGAGGPTVAHRTQQHETLYQRIYESTLAHMLVRAPPQAMLDASGACAAMFSSMLRDTDEDREAAGNLRSGHIIEDVRPWARQVPGFALIAGTTTDAEALDALRAFLGRKPATGPEMIGQTYLMVMMSLEQQSLSSGSGFMEMAKETYAVIRAASLRDRAHYGTLLSEGAGITLLHQPPAVQDPGLVASERPSTVQRWGERRLPGETEDREPGQVVLTEAMQVQLDSAQPVAAGLSGTAGILLHMYDAMRKRGLNGVAPHVFLLNSMVFFIHDGGHSMHEVLWVANLLDRQLALGLDLGDPERPNEFVADFDRFASGFTGDMKTAVGNAMDQAWDGTQQYLEKNSFFAQ